MELEKFYVRGYDWLINRGPNIIVGLILLLVGLWVIRLLVRWAHSGMHKRDVDPSLKPFLLSLISAGMRILLILAVMQIVGIQMTVFAAVIGAFGVAAGLALSGTLQNFASGVLILLLKPFNVGDNIVTQGQEGTVTSIQIFYTIVTTFDNKTVIVPNSKLSNEVIINLSREGTRRLDIELEFKYGTDHEQIMQLISQSVESSGELLKTPKKRVGISDIGPDGYHVTLNVWVQAHGFNDAKLELQSRIITDLKNAGIKLPGMELNAAKT